MRRDTAEWREAGGLYRAVHRIGRPLVRASFRIHARGLENIPPEGPCLLVPNHHSWADGLVTGAVCPRPIRFIGKAELFRSRWWRWFFRAGNVIPVDREKDDGARTAILPPGANAEAMREAIAALARGNIVGIYPEGTLRKPHDRGRNKTGVASLALLTGVPVVPLAEVTHHFWPGYAWIPRFGRRTQVLVGPPLRFAKDPEAARDRARLQEVADEIMAEVYRLWEEAEAARRRGDRWTW